MVKLRVPEPYGASPEPSTPAENPANSEGRSDIACVVVNYNTPDDLRRCIDSCFEVEGPVYWSIYNNKPPTEEVGARSKNFWVIADTIVGRSQWTVVQNGDQNYGHGAGTNRAAGVIASWVKPEYLFLVNPDCKWVEPIFGKLVSFMEQHPKAGAVGIKQMDSKKQITAGGIIGTMEKPVHRYWRHKDNANMKGRDTTQVPTVAGSAMFVRTKVFEEMGGMLEGKHYYSETWLNYHMQIHGWECWYYGEPWMIHEWHRSSAHGSPLSDGTMKEDRELFRKMCDAHTPPIPHD